MRCAVHPTVGTLRDCMESCMVVDEKIHRYIGLGVFLLALGVYIKTMAPAVSFWEIGRAHV